MVRRLRPPGTMQSPDTYLGKRGKKPRKSQHKTIRTEDAHVPHQRVRGAGTILGYECHSPWRENPDTMGAEVKGVACCPEYLQPPTTGLNEMEGK